MGCENNCVNEHRIKILERDLIELKTKNSSDHEKFFNRIEKDEKDMVDSKGDIGHIKTQLNEISNNVKILMEKPAKRYDTIVVCIITAIISAIVGFLLNGVLPM